MAAPRRRVWFCRHGETEFNKTGRVQGASCDVPLNEKGRAQATELGAQLAEFRPHAVLVSPMRRAQETFEIVQPFLENLPEVVTVADLREVSWGSAEGGSLKEIQGVIKQWQSGDWHARMPNGESQQEILDRAGRVREMLVSRSEERIVIIGHGRMTRNLLSVVTGDQGILHRTDLNLTNCSVVKTEFNPSSNHFVIVPDAAPHDAGEPRRAEEN